MLSLIKISRQPWVTEHMKEKHFDYFRFFRQPCISFITDLVSLRTHNRGKLSGSYKSDSFALPIASRLEKLSKPNLTCVL